MHILQGELEDHDSYCEALENSIMGDTIICSDLCQSEMCFGPWPDQCYLCMDQAEREPINVTDLCRNTTAGDTSQPVYNCSVQMESDK